MRPFRIFNDVKSVRMVAKIGGVRMGPFAVIAILLLMACALIVVMVSNDQNLWMSLGRAA